MKILLVDDHGIVRRGLRELLAEEYPDAKFTEASTGEDAVDAAREQRFDFVVLDISMPRGGGLDALRDLRVRWPDLAVLVLSQHDEAQYAVRALRAGARAYLTKDRAPDELVRATRKILAGGRYVTQTLAERLVDALDVDPTAPAHAALSNRELQVLRLLASGKPVKVIALELALSEKTVSTYRTRLLEKLRMKNNAELMRYAIQVRLVD